MTRAHRDDDEAQLSTLEERLQRIVADDTTLVERVRAVMSDDEIEEGEEP